MKRKNFVIGIFICYNILNNGISEETEETEVVFNYKKSESTIHSIVSLVSKKKWWSRK